MQQSIVTEPEMTRKYFAKNVVPKIILVWNVLPGVLVECKERIKEYKDPGSFNPLVSSIGKGKLGNK